MAELLTFTVPLPPPSLRANSRSFWAAKKKDADAYSESVWHACHTRALARAREWGPWLLADVHYEWRYAGVMPDHGNVPGNVKYLQDILCVAPPLSPSRAMKYKRWHLGLVEDDKGIHATYDMVKVPHKSEECVVIRAKRVE